MGFPRPAPMKPHEINWRARHIVGGGAILWTFGFWAFAEFYLDLFRPVKEKLKSRENDPRYVRDRIRRDDEEGIAKIHQMYQSNVTASQLREAKLRWGEAQLTNEVRDFFIKGTKGNDGATSADKDSINLDDLKAGVHGKVVFTRSVEKEKEIQEKKKPAEEAK